MSEDEKPVVDISLLRNDILEFMKEFDPIQEKNVADYLKKTRTQELIFKM